ncbi:MAG: AmmeMemoRadiSam system protein A [Eubacterium sp.]|nr:AmmeMemoRadiSam system protein A [Eubacterium sp.]
MSILGSYMVPHPPLIVPEVGRGGEVVIQKTTESYHRVTSEIAALKPELVIVTSPHAPSYRDWFAISGGETATGSFANFSAPQVKIEAVYDREFTKHLTDVCSREGFPAGAMPSGNETLDHGTMIPLYFLNQHYTDYRLVRIGLAGFPLQDHYRLGALIKKAVEDLDRRAVFIASGDLSHTLKEDGPYGLSKEGPVYDERIMADMGSGNLRALTDYDEDFLDAASECGHRSFTIMAGAMSGQSVSARALSHEGVTGVGYGICTFYPLDSDTSESFDELFSRRVEEDNRKRSAAEDEYITLARQSMETYVKTGRRMAMPHTLPEEMYSTQAGAFVSLKINGRLRGCIGTIGPVQDNLALEIIENAVSACSRDPRFVPVKAAELPYITVSVDVLGESEIIDSEDMLDVRNYGVIVTKGNRRGLLLPNLEGVDTVRMQVDIAKEKAGIPTSDKDVELRRFKVVRHEVI